MAVGDSLEAVQDGSRWLHAPPAADKVVEWFRTQPIHDGMEHDPYVAGIIVLPQTETIQVSKEKNGGGTYTVEEERAVYVPYVNISTRVRYFHDYVRHLRDGDGGIDVLPGIRPIRQNIISELANAYYNENLPEGFSIAAIKNRNDSVNRYFVATFEVAVVEREFARDWAKGEPTPVWLGGRGTKQVPANYRSGWGDDSALMKAETGAVGRALGMGGILVIGTGVATAEDVQEAIAGSGSVVDAPAAPQAPITPEQAAPAALGDSGAVSQDPAADDVRMRERALELQREIEADYPEAWATYKAWWAERQFPPLADLAGPALKGAVTKLERDLDAAKTAAASG